MEDLIFLTQPLGPIFPAPQVIWETGREARKVKSPLCTLAEAVFSQPSLKWLRKAYPIAFGHEDSTFAGSRLTPSRMTCISMLGSVSVKGKSKSTATQRPDRFFFPSRRRPQQKSSNLLLGVNECEFWLSNLHRLVGRAESTGSEGFLERK